MRHRNGVIGPFSKRLIGILTAQAFRGGFIVDHGDQLMHRFEAHFVVRKLQGGQRGLEHVRNERLVVDAITETFVPMPTDRSLAAS